MAHIFNTAVSLSIDHLAMDKGDDGETDKTKISNETNPRKPQNNK